MLGKKCQSVAPSSQGAPCARFINCGFQKPRSSVLCRDFWPIADRRVSSDDPRNNCETHFGSSFLLVFPFRAEFSGINWKHVVFHIRTVAGGPTLRPRRCLVLRPWRTIISVNRPAGVLFYSVVAAQSEAIVVSRAERKGDQKGVGASPEPWGRFFDGNPGRKGKSRYVFFLSSIIQSKTKIEKKKRR